MSDRDIWKAYVNNNRSNRVDITEMYKHVLNEDNPFGQSWNPTPGAAGYTKPETSNNQPVQSTGTDYGALPDSKIMQLQSELVESWIHSGGYVDREGVVSAILFRAIYYSVDWNKLHTYVANDLKNQVSLSDVVQGGFKKQIVEQIKQVVRDDVSQDVMDNLYYTIFGITFAENTVSVGRGELILSLFTSCKKGSVGDLEYLQGTNSSGDKKTKPEGGLQVDLDGQAVQVEVKTGKGRAVSARGGMFKKANLAIEAAVMGVDPRKAKEIITNGEVTTITHDGQEIAVMPRTKGKKIISYEPIDSGMLSSDEFIKALGHADSYLEKLSPYTKSKEALGSLLPKLESGVTDPNQIRKIRHDISLACILYAYANGENGFKYLLIIKQSGKDALVSTPASVESGTFEDVELIDCSELENIYDAMQTGNLTLTRGGSVEGKSLDGEGVYVSYAGSNTNVQWMAGRSTLHSDKKRGEMASWLKPSQKKN